MSESFGTQHCAAASTVLDVPRAKWLFDTMLCCCTKSSWCFKGQMIVRHNAVLLHQQFLMFQRPNDCSTQRCAAAPTVLDVSRAKWLFDTTLCCCINSSWCFKGQMIIQHNTARLHQQFLKFRGPNDCSTQCCAAASTVLDVSRAKWLFDTMLCCCTNSS